MIISQKAWRRYLDGLRKVNDAAANQMAEYLRTHSVETQEEIKAALDYAYALSTKYGEGAAELACEMYDAMAEAAGVQLPPAVPAETATYGEVAKAVQGAMKQSMNPDLIGSAVGRQVKTTGVDTTMKNALRDGAEWAWIPAGDTCAFCLTLASRGWQTASKKALRNGHAEHIHANCDCTYAVRFDHDTNIDGYDPDVLLEQYYAAGDTPNERINAMRRAQYAKNKDAINAQKRMSYEKNKVRETIKQLEIEADRWVERLNENEKRSIEKYAFNPGDNAPNRFFERVNSMLRGDIPSDENLERHVEGITSGIKKFNVERSFPVYRRVDHDPSSGLEIGDLFRGEQFFSSSVDPEKALKKDFLIKIIVKKGTSAAYIDSLSQFDQTELLLDKDVIYQVKSKTETELLLEVIP